ncbi:MAG: penicillin acylase family protein [Pseudomonadota bacterium]|nr:penicillin acylase family protein [Pseudomonadota bacterium]
MRPGTFRRWSLRLSLIVLVIVVLVFLLAWWQLHRSLPTLEGGLALPGLAAPATVHRDAHGTVTIDATNEADAIRALGYVHAQERFFEMDLLRRTAAGELAALFGARALETDRAHRVHRFRARTRAQFAAIAGDKRALLQAYAAGVNAGLVDLQTRPWPYLLLRQQPQPWLAEDTPLVIHAMYFDLQGGTNKRELALARVRPHLPPSLFALITHPGSTWDAPLKGNAVGDAKLPTSDAANLRRLPRNPHEPDWREPPPARGSNNFAVAGALTHDGRAIVANDMHLGLRAPNIWFRARLRYDDSRVADGRIDVTGFTLPGAPGVVVGSNRHIAWGFTNAYGDWLDWATAPACAGKDNCNGVRMTTERIDVAGGDPELLQVAETVWGPVLKEGSNKPLALRWTAHLPGGTNMALFDLARARNVDEALRVADGVGLPAQNLVIADRTGRIAWRLLGPVPLRAPGCDAMRVNDAARCPPWRISSAATPAIVDPPAGRLWTANARVVEGAALKAIGDGGYVLAVRAHMIRERLVADNQFDERQLLAMQLDDRSVFLQRWWTLLHAQSSGANVSNLRRLAQAAPRLEPNATADAVGYRLVRDWRVAVHRRIADGLLAPAKAALGKSAEMPAIPHLEAVAWPLVTQQPAHLLPAQFRSWDALFDDAADEVMTTLEAKGPLAQRTWGERNTARICHPLAAAVPLIGRRMLCMPGEPLRGDTLNPRAQSPDSGASQRMVVAPGHEQDGITHMPGGQSGHPLSPFWGAGHDDWVQGRATPFLPGKAVYSMALNPVAE